jgi:hypothetical protein
MATACPSSARLSGPNGPHNPRRLCPGRKPNPAGTSVGTTLIGTAIVSVGSWSLDTNLAAGSYSSLNVVATDLAGNSTTAINAQTIIVDQTNPTVSSVTTSEIGIDASGNGDLNASSTYWSTGNDGTKLIKFDVGSGATTVVGSFTSAGTYGLAFAPDGSVYTLVGSNAILAKVDLSTGALITIGGPGGSSDTH